jgi:leader peptidase (prepilin peptidase)/N-methyltransferase
MPAPDWTLLLRRPVFEVTVFLVGLLVGSFANVCIHRLPRGKSIVFPPSSCPSCDVRIAPRDNVPVVSFLLLRGRCRACGARISWRYPAVEAANGVLWLALAVLRGPHLQTLVALALVTALLVLSLIDLEHQILPDAITLPGIVVGLAAAFLPGSRTRPLAALAAATGGWLFCALLALAWKKLRGIDALGEGDWKMTAMLGAFFGWERLLLTLLLATASGAGVGILAILLGKGGLKSRLPLGSFLGVAAIVMVLFGDVVLAGYRVVSLHLADAILAAYRGLFGG